MVFLISPCAFTPAWASTSTAAATAAFASSVVSAGASTPTLGAVSRSRRWRTHTSPLDNTDRSRAATTARSEISEWSTATRILSYIDLAPSPLDPEWETFSLVIFLRADHAERQRPTQGRSGTFVPTGGLAQLVGGARRHRPAWSGRNGDDGAVRVAEHGVHDRAG